MPTSPPTHDPYPLANDFHAPPKGSSLGSHMSSAIDPAASREPEGPTNEKPAKSRRKLSDRIEAFVSRLSTRNNFWHRICSMIWLPYAFRSGIRMKRVDERTFTAILPFKKFNRNWYNAMAGAALLGNAEIAGGTYVFGACGGDYTVVCKRMDYRFLRPCFGPAIYRIEPKDDIDQLIATGEEFNITVWMHVVQQLPTTSKKEGMLPRLKEKRVGKAIAEFHLTPKVHQKKKGRMRTWGKSRSTDDIVAEREAQRLALERDNPGAAPEPDQASPSEAPSPSDSRASDSRAPDSGASDSQAASPAATQPTPEASPTVRPRDSAESVA